ncbi:MAG: hypothetical protein LBH13_00815 [Cellulomonadaceae bacterium]|jgi:hypothetical protein|nr:hypothetical protein [Cellulomonadaceae bacterium]
MPLGYRAHFDVHDHDSVVETALDAFHKWLLNKGYDVSKIGVGKPGVISDNATASISTFDIGESTVRARVDEAGSEGTWTSLLTIHVPEIADRDAEVLLEIYSPESQDNRPVRAGVPRLARTLLSRLSVNDSLAAVSDVPLLVTAGQVPELVAAITDPNRRGLLFAAGSTPGLPYDEWSSYVGKLLRQTTGLGSSYVLDADATELLEGSLGALHTVSGGTLRTYLPGVDIESELDAKRHRILSTNRIVNDSPKWIAGVLGRRALENALERSFTPDFQKVLDDIESNLDNVLLSGLSGTVENASGTDGSMLDPSPLDEAVRTPELVDSIVKDEPTLTVVDEVYLAAMATMKLLLGTDHPSTDDWRRLEALARAGQGAESRLREVADRLTGLKSDLAASNSRGHELTRRLEDEQLENADNFGALTVSEREVRRLRNVLLRTELATAAFFDDSATSEPDYPTSFVDLLASISELPGISFTGDKEKTTALDVQDPMGVWAGKTWGALLALSDYSKASREGRANCDVHGYLQNTPAGYRGYSANKHTSVESEDVENNPKFFNARVFTVPSSVSPDGSAAMMAHFKIAQSGLVSPRLHYLDDTARSGLIVVGYIGPHLPTQKTN